MVNGSMRTSIHEFLREQLFSSHRAFNLLSCCLLLPGLYRVPM
jgi:hypothetical protein